MWEDCNGDEKMDFDEFAEWVRHMPLSEQQQLSALASFLADPFVTSPRFRQSFKDNFRAKVGGDTVVDCPQI
jgi:hypothetical protein